MMDASILITSYKRPLLLKHGLTSLNECDFGNYNVEILVLNDGIHDETSDICKLFPNLNIRYIFTGQRNLEKEVWRVPGFAFNIGAKLALGNVLFFTCPEVYHYSKHHIKDMITELKNNSKIRITCNGKYDDGKALLSLNTSNVLPLDVYNSLSPLQVKFPYFMGYLREHFLNIGGYDEDFIGIAGEDDDILDRLDRCGILLKIIDGDIIHLYHESFHNWRKDLYDYNLRLLQTRKGIIKRNIGREWGVL
jgi:glycosyltransferase involved in cell wall biosynthesis